VNVETFSHALREATADIEPSPDLAGRAIRGGRRRVLRRWIQATSGLAVAVLLGGFAVVALRPAAVDTEPDDRFNRPTAGDLAGDEAFRAEAVRAWREGLRYSYNADRGIFDDFRGDPHVLWAGTTAAGRTAVVLQRAYLHRHGNLSSEDWGQFQTLVGLVAPDPRDGQLKLVADQYQPHGFPPPGYFLFGPDDRTVLVVDRGIPLYFSPEPRQDPARGLVRDWRRLRVTGGVAIAHVPAGADAEGARVFARATPPPPGLKDRDGMLYLERSSEYLKAADALRRGEELHSNLGADGDRRLQWNAPEAQPMRVGQPRPALPNVEQTFSGALEEAGFVDVSANIIRHSLWFVLAGLPDNRTAIVGETQEDSQESRLYTVLLKSDGSVERVLSGGVARFSAALPVVVRLPDGAGWVVAAYQWSLEFRTAAGPDWQPAGTNAALLPDAATQVRVTRPGAQPTVVTLPA